MHGRKSICSVNGGRVSRVIDGKFSFNDIFSLSLYPYYRWHMNDIEEMIEFSFSISKYLQVALPLHNCHESQNVDQIEDKSIEKRFQQ